MINRGGRLMFAQLVASTALLGAALGNAIINWHSAINMLTVLIASVNLVMVISIYKLRLRRQDRP